MVPSESHCAHISVKMNCYCYCYCYYSLSLVVLRNVRINIRGSTVSPVVFMAGKVFSDIKGRQWRTEWVGVQTSPRNSEGPPKSCQIETRL